MGVNLILVKISMPEVPQIGKTLWQTTDPVSVLKISPLQFTYHATYVKFL